MWFGHKAGSNKRFVRISVTFHLSHQLVPTTRRFQARCELIEVAGISPATTWLVPQDKRVDSCAPGAAISPLQHKRGKKRDDLSSATWLGTPIPSGPAG